MKSKLGNEARLKHDCIVEIETAVGGINETDFINNHVLRIAVVKWIEIIGEASVYLSEEIKEKYPATDWVAIKGMRNIVVHEYFGIKFDLIWEVASEHIPALKEQVEVMLKELN